MSTVKRSIHHRKGIIKDDFEWVTGVLNPSLKNKVNYIE